MRRLMTTDRRLKWLSCSLIGLSAATGWGFALEYMSDLQEARRG